MKFSISHIAWPYEEEDKFLPKLKEWSCDGIEVAASRIWPEPINSTREERAEYKKHVSAFGLEISAMQALLYSRKDLGLFRGSEIEKETIKYVKNLCYVAADLGAKVMVFGSPANRRLNGISLNDGYSIAAAFFSEIAETATNLGVCLCIEPLGSSETDFINTCVEGLKLVQMVNSPGFGLHLDSKALSEEGSQYLENLRSVLPFAKHYHISEPNLAETNSSGTVPHAEFAGILNQYNYPNFVSIEMRTWPEHFDVVSRSIQYSRKTYFLQ